MKTESPDPEIIDVDCDGEVATGTATDDQTAADNRDAEDAGRVRPRRRRIIVAFLACLACLAIAACAAWAYLFFAVSARDEAIAPGKQQVAVDAAANAAVAILTYKSETVDSDLEAANNLLTGTFGEYYRSFTRDVVAPAAKEKHISTSASVVGKGISTFSEGRASVLVFLNQSTTTAEAVQPTTTSTTILVEVERHGDTWLVSKFDPA